NPQKVLDKVNDLFLTLATEAEQLEFPVFYAIGRDGKAYTELPKADSEGNFPPADIKPLLEAIVSHFPAPVGDANEPLQMQITSLEYDSHLGRLLVGKIKRGTARIGDSIIIL